MDAFAVAVCKGLADSKFDFKKKRSSSEVASDFFSADAPDRLLYRASVLIYIAAIDHWLIFGLLRTSAVNMIREARRGVCEADTSVNFKNMLMLSLATSIDALAAGSARFHAGRYFHQRGRHRRHDISDQHRGACASATYSAPNTRKKPKRRAVLS
jgi:putative Mn2+ efflux pump MntP